MSILLQTIDPIRINLNIALIKVNYFFCESGVTSSPRDFFSKGVAVHLRNPSLPPSPPPDNPTGEDG